MTNLDSGAVAARRTLLDALQALAPHLRAVVLVGAQAIYLQLGHDRPGIAAYTFDADLIVDPNRLGDAPRLEEAMTAGGFTLLERDSGTEPGVWRKATTQDGHNVEVPIDLIVPAAALPPSSRRSVSLPPHDRMALRRTPGLEVALLDYSVMSVTSWDPSDDRAIEANVAGPAALIVAKLHKLHDRSQAGVRSDRLRAKDASDVVRLMQAFPPAAVAGVLAPLRGDSIAGSAITRALDYLPELFGASGRAGVRLAAGALRGAVPDERVRAVAVGWSRRLLSELD